MYLVRALRESNAPARGRNMPSSKPVLTSRPERRSCRLTFISLLPRYQAINSPHLNRNTYTQLVLVSVISHIVTSSWCRRSKQQAVVSRLSDRADDMDDTTFQQELVRLKERVSQMAANYNPTPKFGHPFTADSFHNQLHDLKARLESMQASLTSLAPPIPSNKPSPQPAFARQSPMPDNMSFVPHNQLTLNTQACTPHNLATPLTSET